MFPSTLVLPRTKSPSHDPMGGSEFGVLKGESDKFQFLMVNDLLETF